MNNNDLVLLVRSALRNQGALSNNRRKMLIARGHRPELLDAAVAALNEVFNIEGDVPHPLN